MIAMVLKFLFFAPLDLLRNFSNFNIIPYFCSVFYNQALPLRLRPAVDLGSTRVGSCAYRRKWRAGMLPTIFGGISSIQLIQ